MYSKEGSKMNTYEMLDRALAAVDAQTANIDRLTEDTKLKSQLIEAQTKNIQAQSKDIQILKTENAQLKHQVNHLMNTVSNLQVQVEFLTQENSRLVLENQKMSNRLDSIEARLELLDKQMAHLAPTVRYLLEQQDSVLLSPDYRDIRDSIETEEFSSTTDIIVIQNLDQTRYKSLHGMSSALGRSLVGFYQIVLGYKPRFIKGKAGYWLLEESPVIDPGLSLAKSLNVA
jgi:regulator of replication initiation timing